MPDLLATLLLGIVVSGVSAGAVYAVWRYWTGGP